jgi:hypothetical protein
MEGNRAMKFLAFLALLAAVRQNKAHNDNLRAGQYPDAVFTPWKIAVS